MGLKILKRFQLKFSRHNFITNATHPQYLTYTKPFTILILSSKSGQNIILSILIFTSYNTGFVMIRDVDAPIGMFFGQDLPRMTHY